MDFEVKDHMQLGAALGLIDFEAGAAVAGAKFAYLRGSHRRPARYLAVTSNDLLNDSIDLAVFNCKHPTGK